MEDFTDRIIGVVGSSRVPERAPIDWDMVEARVGTVLPRDYKRLLSEYHQVAWGTFWLFNPREETPGYMDPLEATENLEEILRDLCEDEGEEKELNDLTDLVGESLTLVSPPLAFYPSVPGLLCWGKDANGWDFFWVVDGPPDSWPVVSRTEAGEWWDEHAMSMSEYLYRLHTEGRLCRSCPQLDDGPAVFNETGP